MGKMGLIQAIIKVNVEIIKMNFNSKRIFSKIKITYEINHDLEGYLLIKEAGYGDVTDWSDKLFDKKSTKICMKQ